MADDGLRDGDAESLMVRDVDIDADALATLDDMSDSDGETLVEAVAVLSVLIDEPLDGDVDVLADAESVNVPDVDEVVSLESVGDGDELVVAEAVLKDADGVLD